VDGAGDVDSGPLILGISLSATAVTMGAARVHNDRRLAASPATAADVAGIPVDTLVSSRYALGVLPIGGSFVAWSETARPWVSPLPPDLTRWWRAPVLLPLALIIAAAARTVARQSSHDPSGSPERYFAGGWRSGLPLLAGARATTPKW
jgi:hypothetical protein